MNAEPQALFDDYMNDALPPAGMEALCGWIKTDPRHADCVARLMLLESDLHERLVDLDRRPINVLPGASTLSSRRPAAAKIRYGPIGSALAAAVILAATLWLVSRDDSSSGPDTQMVAPQMVHEHVATLTNLEDAVFTDAARPMNLGSALTPGPIRLSSGRAQVMFASTAVVDLKGPCVFEMTGPNRGRLLDGRLDAYIPEDARGFTVDLPHGARVVDLGTEFTLRVDQSGNVDLGVLQGRVLIIDRHGTSRHPIGHGQFVHLNADGMTDLNDPLLNYAGVDRAIGGALRNVSIEKTLDADGDNVYGTAGGVFWNVTPISPADRRMAGVSQQPVDDQRVRRLPSFIADVREAPDTHTARDFHYLAIDDPSEAPSQSPRQVESGVLVSTPQRHQSLVHMLTIRVGEQPPDRVRLGLLVNNANKPILTPARIRLESGTEFVETELKPIAGRLEGEMHFFDLANLKTGQELRVMFEPRDSARPTTLGALTFDRLPSSGP